MTGRTAPVPRALIVSGPPGSGKSTVSRLLADDSERSALIRGDDFFAFVRRGWVAPWLPEAQPQNDVVTEAAAAATGQFVRGGYAVVYDGVVGPWYLPSMIRAAALDAVDYVVLLPPEETCVDRVRGRAGHGFTDEAATRRMHRELAAAGLPARHLVTDAAATAAGVVAEIQRRRRDGVLLVRGDQ